MGYHRAGFEVVGVDIKPQPHYPFEFYQADALEYLSEHGREFDLIHASPPCQAFSAMTNGRWQNRLKGHPDLIEPTRKLLVNRGNHTLLRTSFRRSINQPCHVMRDDVRA